MTTEAGNARPSARNSVPRVLRALLSVSDKQGLIEFASALSGHGIELLSTGGTARALAAAGIAVREVSDYTGFPEMMDGRLKTLHPKVHGGLLARRDQSSDTDAMRAHGILPIDLLVVNLYPFEKTVADPHCRFEDAVEQIDIGGPAMLRAAAKNHASVAAVTDPADYAEVLSDIARLGGVSDALRRRLAATVFRRLAGYDAAIACYLAGTEEVFPEILTLSFERKTTLRYGENPHQRAALYAAPGAQGLAHAHQLQGKELSFNNLLDSESAWACVQAFADPTCVIVKHGNPCGVAEEADLTRAYERAYATDSTSAFGGVIAVNRPLDAGVASAILGRQFVEVIIAPSVTPAAAAVLTAKANIRVLVPGPAPGPSFDLRRISGGLLVQEQDLADLPSWRVVSRRAPTGAELRDLVFAWRVAKFVKSNAIVYARDLATIGVGAGQMSRVDSARIAARKAEDAGLTIAGSCLASDAFFPFRDGVDHAAEAGVRAVIQPGGSMRDEEVIAAADKHDVAMVFTGLRHFRH